MALGSDTILVAPVSVGAGAMTAWLVRRRDRVVAVTPIVGGRPVKGPADRLMAPLGIEVSCVGVARAYREVLGV